MKKMLKRTIEIEELYWIDANGVKQIRGNPDMTGDYSSLRGNCTGLWGGCSGLYGDCTILRGDCTGLRGDCTILRGSCTGLSGNLDECELDGHFLIEIDELVGN